MPIHDWTRVDAGLFHDFHQGWIVALRTALNSEILPEGYFALVEQRTPGLAPDVLTLESYLPDGGQRAGGSSGGVAVAEAPPQARIVQRLEEEAYAAKADRITVRHRHGEVVAILEIVSPGNKHSRTALRAFVEKAADCLANGIHLVIVDLFPPTPRDPHGLHAAIWDDVGGQPPAPISDKPLTVVAYRAGAEKVAYVEPVGIGDGLPEPPLFLTADHYVRCPLEATYLATWGAFPSPLKGLLTAPSG